jgi:carboxypeptidase Q
VQPPDHFGNRRKRAASLRKRVEAEGSQSRSWCPDYKIVVGDSGAARQEPVDDARRFAPGILRGRLGPISRSGVTNGRRPGTSVICCVFPFLQRTLAVMNRVRATQVLLAICLLGVPAGAQVAPPPPSANAIDYDAMYRIKEEGFERSQVMETASWLTDVYGPRLTGSPNIKAAGDWAVKKLTEWGAQNAHLEPWGTFGRGWQNERFSASVVAPTPWPIIGGPKAWTPGTDGVITAEAVFAPIEDEKDLEKWKGKLKGKIVLAFPTREVKASFDPLATRFSDIDLKKLEEVDPTAKPRRKYNRALFAFVPKRLQFLMDEGVAAVLEPSRSGDGGTVFVQQGGLYNAKAPQTYVRYPENVPTQVVVAVEHYNRIARVLQKKVPVSIELNVKNAITESEDGFNVIAEIPGTDKADELVMLGAHFDSWHTGTGATDNAAGSAVMMEAMRILKASGVKMRRTVRLALWGGEEQGLLGSKAYVKANFADKETMALKPAHAKISGYFNIDNGTGAIRGVYLQGNDAIGPLFSDWMKPFASLGMTMTTPQNTSGTDHLSFDAVGIPAFQFVQDEVEYESRTHHSNMDVWDRLQASDMMKNAVIVASFVYDAATREQMLPRKPLPKPQPAQPTTAPAAKPTQD